MSQGRHVPIYLSFDLKGQCHEICYSIFWVSYIKAENTDIKESVTPRNFADIQISPREKKKNQFGKHFLPAW